MKTLKRLSTLMLILFVLHDLFISTTASAQKIDSLKTESHNKHTIQLNALELIGHLYSAVYLYQFSPKNHMMLGLAYQNFRYDFGTVHAPGVIVGYKRFIWSGLYAECSLWPAYNSFYEKNERKYYEDFELWSEVRLGYDFTFNIKGLSLFISPQIITGTAIVEGRKPQSFLDYYETQRVAGNIAFGIHF